VLQHPIVSPYADPHGRKPVLAAAGVVAALTSLLLAVLPDASTIGVAPRCPHRASGGGGFRMAAACRLRRRVDAGMPPRSSDVFATFNVVAGWTLALAVPLLLDAVLSESQYSDWGWRVAVLPAVALGVLSFILRRRLAESALFSRIRDAGELSPSPLRELFATQWRSCLAMTLQVGMVSAAFSRDCLPGQLH
jgi:MFS family permease